MNEIKNLQIKTEVVGITNEHQNPNFFVRAYETTITFSTDHYPGLCDRELVKEMLEQLIELQHNLDKNQPVTELIQVK